MDSPLAYPFYSRMNAKKGICEYPFVIYRLCYVIISLERLKEVLIEIQD